MKKAFFYGPLVPLSHAFDRIKGTPLVNKLRSFRLTSTLNQGEERIRSLPAHNREMHMPHVGSSQDAANLNADLAYGAKRELRLLFLDSNSLLIRVFDLPWTDKTEESILAILPFLPVALATRNAASSFYVVSGPANDGFTSEFECVVAENIHSFGRIFGIPMRDFIIIDAVDSFGGVRWHSVFDEQFQEPVLLNRRGAEALIGSGCVC